MLILYQNEAGFVDFDKLLGIEAEEVEESGHGLVIAYGYDNASIPVGEYKTLDRAKEIVKEIYAIEGCMSRYELPIV